MKKLPRIYFVPDFLFVFLLFIILTLLVLGAVFRTVWLLFVGILIAAYLFFRIFSRNLPARIRENEIFCHIFFALPRLVQRLFRRGTDRKHIHSHCPSCGATLRLEKKAGDFTVTCPRCGARFPIHIR